MKPSDDSCNSLHKKSKNQKTRKKRDELRLNMMENTENSKLFMKIYKNSNQNRN